MPVEKIDPTTGAKWRLIHKFYETWWFEGLMLFACAALSFLLIQLLDDVWTLWQGASSGFHNLQLAEALRSGHGFATASGAGQWMSDTMTPPMYPMMLAAVMALLGIDGTRVEPLFWFNLFIYSIATVQFFRFAARRFDKPIPIILTLLFGLTPGVVESLGRFDAIIPFMALLMFLVNFVDDRFDEPGVSKLKQSGLIILILAMAALISTHPAGWVVLMAFLTVLLRHYGIQKTLITLIAISLLAAPWMIRNWTTQSVSGQVSSGTLWPWDVTAVHSPYPSQLNGVTEQVSDQGIIQAVLHATTVQALGAQSLVQHRQNPLYSKFLSSFDLGLDGWSFLQWAVVGTLLMGLLYGYFYRSGISALTISLFVPWAVLWSLLHGSPNLLSSVAIFLPIFPLILVETLHGMVRICGWFKPYHLKMLSVASTVFCLLFMTNVMGTYVEDFRIEHLPASETASAIKAVQSNPVEVAGVNAMAIEAEPPSQGDSILPRNTSPTGIQQVPSTTTAPQPLPQSNIKASNPHSSGLNQKKITVVVSNPVSNPMLEPIQARELPSKIATTTAPAPKKPMGTIPLVMVRSQTSSSPSASAIPLPSSPLPMGSSGSGSKSLKKPFQTPVVSTQAVTPKVLTGKSTPISSTPQSSPPSGSVKTFGFQPEGTQGSTGQKSISVSSNL